MEMFKKANQASIIISLLIFISSSVFPGQLALSPTGTIQRSTKLQLLASLPPSQTTTPTSGSSQIFLTSSPSGKYSAYLLRQATGGFGNDLCYIQVQEGGSRNVWQSECISVSNADTCSLVFSDAGLEIFDGSKSAWNTEHLKSLSLLDAGDMQIIDQDGKIVWKASDHNSVVNRNCRSIGGSALPPSSSIYKEKSPFEEESQFVYDEQQQDLGLNQPFSTFNQPFSSMNQPFGLNNQQGMDNNNSFDSGVSGDKTFNLGVLLGFLYSAHSHC